MLVVCGVIFTTVLLAHSLTHTQPLSGEQFAGRGDFFTSGAPHLPGEVPQAGATEASYRERELAAKVSYSDHNNKISPFHTS